LGYKLGNLKICGIVEVADENIIFICMDNVLGIVFRGYGKMLVYIGNIRLVWL
jgi:hypothetical protein